ncbi:MAG: hypothetical protein KC496_01855 [Anaerolineae bacterium]|nr:hypothetical protein [Anaerolineae bacterium]
MIKVYWENEDQSIIRLDYSEPIESWDEYTSAVKESFAMIRTKPHKVHMIHNPGNTQMPGGNPFSIIGRLMDQLPANGGMIVMVIANPFARRMMDLLLKITIGAKNYYFVKELDEAHNLIQAQQKKEAAYDV